MLQNSFKALFSLNFSEDIFIMIAKDLFILLVLILVFK